MPLPNFILVGAPKAGTTSLYHYLRSHPDVFMSGVKEPHYFYYIEELMPAWGVSTLGAYEALFDGVSGEQAVGEASTWYLYSETAAFQIRRAIPEARILALLRNPVDRAYSSWAYRVQMGWETESFEGALDREDERHARGDVWDVHYMRAGLYADQVERYFQQFPAEHVRVMLFEDMATRPQKVVRESFTFLGEEPDAVGPDVDQVHNKTVLPRSPLIARMMKHGRLSSAVRGLVPPGTLSPLRKALSRVNQRARPPLDPALRARLTDQCRPDVRRLSDLLGQDLESRWFGPLAPPLS